jgi:anti-anti-sigma factor
VKCYELTKCTEKEREACYVWTSFKGNPQDLDNIKCWILKGVYNEENKEQYKKCQHCSYYLKMNRESGIASDLNADLAIITCEGTINNERNTALEKTWQTLKKHNKNKVLLDLSRVNNIYSSGLGTIITIHKDTQAAKGLLIVICPDGYVKNLFSVTKLARILTVVADQREARDAFEAHKQLLAKKIALAAAAQEPVRQKTAPKERPACYVYWKNKNPRNATTCDECFKKIKPSQQPCWIVDGMIEGISFQYVNEDCETCPYFEEFGKAGE